jgi:hypothetical protein
MDQIYLWIIILFGVILILDYSERTIKNKKEKFENKISNIENTNTNFGLFDNNFNTNASDNNKENSFPPYYEENRLNVYQPTISTNTVQMSSNAVNGNLNYSNFGTNGVEPPYVKCPACNIQFDCSNYPYDMSDKNGNVCTTCYEKTFLDNNNMPVYSRANGKPRVCRKLN